MPLSRPPKEREEDDVDIPDAPNVVDFLDSDLEDDAAPSLAPKDIGGSTNSKAKVSLEGMFDDEDGSDDEYSSSAPAAPQQVPQDEVPKPTFKPTPSTVKYSEPEILRAFYQRLFPFRYLFQWLNHSPLPTNDFAHREFAFTLQNDAYARYQSFPNAEQLRKQCMQLTPPRFEIGPVYSTNPRERKTLRKATHFHAVAKELVFDIDMSDYDAIRRCCAGAAICVRCWRWIAMAVNVIDAALRADFGYRHILWVYSGRRGAHAWVCDRAARDLDDRARRAIAGYLELVRGGDSSGKKVNLRRPLHPHVDRSLQLLRENFQSDILLDQDPWADDTHAAHLLSLLPDTGGLRSALQRKWASSPGRSSASKWSDIDTVASGLPTGGGGGGGESTAASSSLATALVHARQEIVLEYTYPRLDADVSKKRNHLLKAPFCVHPGTGRVCVPIDPARVADFDPAAVPTVTELLAEIDEWSNAAAATAAADGEGDAAATAAAADADLPDEAEPDEDAETKPGAPSERRKVADYEKTRLKPYVDFFRKFVAGLMKEEMAARKLGDGAVAGKGDPMEF